MSIDYSNFAIPKPASKIKTKITKIKGRKHRQTKATEISKQIKEAVWERDRHRCIFCGKMVPVFYANAHYIPRSAGGKGIEENIFTACESCHHEQDNGLNSKEYTKRAKEHLEKIYGKDWKIGELVYKKYK